SPDGRFLASMRPNSPAVSIIDVASGQQLHTLTPSGGAGIIVQRFRFNPDSTMLVVIYGQDYSQHQASTSASNLFTTQIKLWDVKTGNEVKTLVSTYPPIEAAFSSDGRTIAMIGAMGDISVWDAQSGQKVRDLTSSPLTTMRPINPGTIKPGQMPQMPNMADISAILNSSLGMMSSGTLGQ